MPSVMHTTVHGSHKVCNRVHESKSRGHARGACRSCIPELVTGWWMVGIDLPRRYPGTMRRTLVIILLAIGSITGGGLALAADSPTSAVIPAHTCWIFRC